MTLIIIIFAIFLVCQAIQHTNIYADSKHRHPDKLRRERNAPVDIEEIIKTAEITRIGQ